MPKAGGAARTPVSARPPPPSRRFTWGRSHLDTPSINVSEHPLRARHGTQGTQKTPLEDRCQGRAALTCSGRGAGSGLGPEAPGNRADEARSGHRAREQRCRDETVSGGAPMAGRSPGTSPSAVHHLNSSTHAGSVTGTDPTGAPGRPTAEQGQERGLGALQRPLMSPHRAWVRGEH